MENTLLTAFDIVWMMFGFMLLFIVIVIPLTGLIRYFINKKGTHYVKRI